MGAVIFLDFWSFRKLGLQPNFAEASGTQFNWAAGITWFITLGVCTWLVLSGGVQIYFVSLPGWFVAAILYILLSKIHQRRSVPAAA
jgi:hypothetical protein